MLVRVFNAKKHPLLCSNKFSQLKYAISWHYAKHAFYTLMIGQPRGRMYKEGVLAGSTPPSEMS